MRLIISPVSLLLLAVLACHPLAAHGQDAAAAPNGTLSAARNMESSLNNCLAMRDTLDGLLISLAAARKSDDVKTLKSILVKTEAAIWAMKSQTNGCMNAVEMMGGLMAGILNDKSKPAAAPVGSGPVPAGSEAASGTDPAGR